MPIEDILAGLDSEQRKAATAEYNTVVAAGAGSGKTKVLAARYAWLVIERGYRVEEILTLTFTNKAVSEMYSRIYGLLADRQDHPRARDALRDFHKAQIATLDSFCAGIARLASRRYGISPDFISDNSGVRELALDAALPFVLDHRDNPALQILMADKKIRTVADELFAETMLYYSPISSPLDCVSFMRVQGEELLRRWRLETQRAAALTDAIAGGLDRIIKHTTSLYTNVKNIFNGGGIPKTPDIAPLLENNGFFSDTAGCQDEAPLRREITLYFEFLYKLQSVNLSGKPTGELAVIKDSIKELRNSIYGELESIANAALRGDIIAAVFPLVDEFQREFNRKKREAGLLTFTDIARLAVDALAEYPDLRQVYKETIKAVMIDEFQDNNSLQRDLIFLLAERLDRRDKGVPQARELCPDKMFFVGDEKQSIYRFRGADVSVFRGLADTLSRDSAAAYLNLRYNYRSKPILIDTFNRVFGSAGRPGVFLSAGENPAAFEALYNPVASPREAGAEDRNNPPVHFRFLDKDCIPEHDPRFLSSEETEAAFIASQIRDMVDRGYPVQERNGEAVSARPCTYRDFAVLQRSYSHQHFLEKQLQQFGVPFNAGRPAGLFTDAPVNDLYNFLRVLLYPGDRLAYAALIRSPFTRLSDAALSVCMVSNSGVPFDQALDSLIPPEELELYRRARERYEALRQDIPVLPITALLTRLWYHEGYRYETIWTEASQAYGELFDLLFELARDIDGRGKSLVDFIDYLDDLMNREEKPDDMDIPPESGEGVRIMSIHKSKGLEFPVVFVYCCGSGGRRQTNTKAVYFHERWGLTLNLPQAEELPENSGNYFFKIQREEERQKEIAELRRLLYVAMTRAESALFLTAALPKQTKEEKRRGNSGEPGTADYIKERLTRLDEKNEGKDAASFLDLLLPVISAQEAAPPFSIQAIPVFSRDELRRMGSRRGTWPEDTVPMREAAKRAAALYGPAEIISSPPPGPDRIPASGLRHCFPGMDAAGNNDGEAEDTGGDTPFKKAGLDAAGFGVIVHGCIEARFSGRPPLIPPRLLAMIDEQALPQIKAAALAMADNFFNSALGSLSLGAPYREAEFPFLTTIINANNVIVTGQIDLLFESGGSIYVIDFKTDRAEAPEKHLGQLAVYARAAADLFGKPVRSWLFYLRNAHAVEVTGRLGEVDIEAMVSAYCLNPMQ